MSYETITSLKRKIKDTEVEIDLLKEESNKGSIIAEFNKLELERRLEKLRENLKYVYESQAKETVSIRMYGDSVEYGKISNRVLVSVLGGFQSVLDSIASVAEGAYNAKGKIKKDAKHLSDFKVCGTFAGSFGIVMEKDSGQHEVSQGTLKTDQVVRGLFDVTENSTDSDLPIRHISPYGKRTLINYRGWLKELKDNAVNLEMNWSDESAEIRRYDIMYNKSDDIIYTLDSLEEVFNEEKTIVGILTGINIRRNTFELNTDGGIIKGTSTLETLIGISNKIGSEVKANMIISTIKTNDYITKTMWYLVNIIS